MNILTYDGTFEGFLTVIFECYERKLSPDDICSEQAFQEVLFMKKTHIASHTEKAKRVWNGLQKRVSKRKKELPFRIFLSELPGIEMKLYRFIRRVFDTKFNIETDFSDPDVLALKQIERKVVLEAMRMLQFVRFQKTKDNIYFSAIGPDHDVLPLVSGHFKARFADQQWLIYDVKRDYGLFYNLNKVEEVVLADKQFNETNGQLSTDILQEREEEYQTLWKDYFTHINIEARKNLRLQRQHMPRRFWKFLPEKDPLLSKNTT